jgi:hypothetical protein
MILIAAETGKRDDIAEATRQTLVALGPENWWKQDRAFNEVIE